jgi:hypothetical protein
MNAGKRGRAFVTMATSLLLLPVMFVEVWACTCMETSSPSEAYWSADAVFTGLVADASPWRARLIVEEKFKGVEEVEVSLSQGGGADCQPIFNQGAKWLIYASRNAESKQLYVLGCERTALVNEATEDLAYLRAPSEWWLIGEWLLSFMLLCIAAICLYRKHVAS